MSQRQEESVENVSVRDIPEIEVPAEALVPVYSNYVAMSLTQSEVILTFCAIVPYPANKRGEVLKLANVARQRVLLQRETALSVTRMLVRQLFGKEAESNLPGTE